MVPRHPKQPCDTVSHSFTPIHLNLLCERCYPRSLREFEHSFVTDAMKEETMRLQTRHYTRLAGHVSMVVMLLCGVAIAGPTIAIYTDADTYQSRDTIEVSLSAQNLGEGMSVDVYVGLLTPDGGLYTLSPYGHSGWSGNLEAWIPDIYVPPDFSMAQTPLWWFDVPCLMPPISQQGQYCFASVLTHPGTLEWVSQASLALFTVGASAVPNYYVNGETGDDSNDGSESYPWRTITHALASALSTPATIHVAPGTYAASTNGETYPLNMKSWVSLSGQGAETTVLDAEGAANHVIYSDEVSNLAIRDFTITGGSAYGTSWSENAGGGIYCRQSSLTIENNVITDNSADWGGGIHCCQCSPTIQKNKIDRNSAEDSGGAIYCFESSPAIISSSVSGNWARYGGGVFCYTSSPTIESSTLTGNSARFRGGAIASWDYSLPKIQNSTISSNSASEGGGIFCTLSWPWMEGNTIEGNSAEGGGGGICCRYNGSPTIQYNTITDNSASDGGGIFCCDNSSPTIENNKIAKNTARFNGAGIYAYWDSFPAIRGNTIMDNSTKYGDGGGIYCNESAPTIANNTIMDNSANDGGGIFCTLSWPWIETNTIMGNSAGDFGDGICARGYPYPAIKDCIIWGNGDELDGCSATYCCIEDPDEGQSNIHDDPMFVTGPFGDYYLDLDSPCIDTGSRSAEEAGLSDRTTQVDGTPDSGQVDMGFHYPLP